LQPGLSSPHLRERRLSSQLQVHFNTRKQLAHAVYYPLSPATAPKLLQKIGGFQRGLFETARVFPVEYMR